MCSMCANHSVAALHLSDQRFQSKIQCWRISIFTMLHYKFLETMLKFLKKYVKRLCICYIHAIVQMKFIAQNHDNNMFEKYALRSYLNGGHSMYSQPWVI